MFKNVEDAVEFVYNSRWWNATAIDIALEPSDDGVELDGDDPSEDLVDVCVENTNIPGVKPLAKPPILNIPTEILVLTFLAIHGAYPWVSVVSFMAYFNFLILLHLF